MKIFIKEYNYFSDVYEYSRNFVNRYIHLYGVKIRRVHNYNDFADQGIYHDPTYPYVHTIISNDPKNFKIPLYGDTFKVLDIIFTSKMKDKGGQAKNKIYIKADTVDLLNVDKYADIFQDIKNTFVHEMAHLYDELLHGRNPSLINKKFGGKYHKASDTIDDPTNDKVKKDLLLYLDQNAEINAYLNVALNIVAKNLINEFRNILKNENAIELIDYFTKINRQYKKNNLYPSLKFVLEHDYGISGKSFVENVVYNINNSRAKTVGLLYDVKNHNLYNLTEKQEKYVYKKAYPTFNKIYNYYAEKIIEKIKPLKNIKYEN